MGKIFISYRHKDWTFAHALYEKLQKRTRGRVWIDLEIERSDFSENIEEELRTSDVYVLVVTNNTFAQDRIHQDGDWVRREIRLALSLNIPIALAIHNGQMPENANSLPPDIQAITTKHGIAIYPGFFDAGVDRLAKHCASLAPGAFQKTNHRLWVFLSAFVFVVFVVIVYFLSITTRPKIHSVGIEGNDENFVVTYDSNGHPLWRREIQGRISEAMLEDLDGNGNWEVLVGVDNSMNDDEPDEHTGWLIVYNSSGDIVDMFNTWEPSIYNAGDSENMRVSALEIADLDGDDQLDIVVISNATYWFASKISILHFSNGNLNIQSRYWNPGLLDALYVGDNDRNGILETVVTGRNNNAQGLFDQITSNVYVVFAFEGTNISGQAPPPGFTDPEITPPGSEIWYRYLPSEAVRVTTVRFEHNQIQIGLSDACSYYLDSDGNVLSLGTGTACRWENTLYSLTQKIMVDTIMRGWIDDTAWFTLYTFQGQAGEALDISISREQGSELSPAVMLLDDTMAPIASEPNARKAADVTLATTLARSGFYYLFVTRFDGESGKTYGRYRLQFQNSN